MPLPSPSETPGSGRPSALEMFTDRVSEQELLSRLMAAHDESTSPHKSDFLTVFYGVGGVGKTTLCQKAVKIAMAVKPSVNVVILNLDSANWSPTSSFAQLLAALIPELTRKGVPTPLTQALLLMCAHTDATACIRTESSDLWSGAVNVIDQATQALGIPGVSLVLKGSNWVNEQQKQAGVEKRLRDLKLLPNEGGGACINLLDLEKKLAQAFFEDLKKWASRGKNLRILLDGFERIQSRERRQDCQLLFQVWAGYLAASKEPSLIGRIRVLIFGRDKLKWDNLYGDKDWPGYWNQHLLEGLGVDDAKDFLEKYSQWLENHNVSHAAAAVITQTDSILDAADEGRGENRRIYPYYLDLAVGLVHSEALCNRTAELGKKPQDLQDCFFRYLQSDELHLLKILALAETIDSELFNSLITAQRVNGFTIDSFSAAVVNGRSYISENGSGSYRFHRIMEQSLQELWTKSESEREQGQSIGNWLINYFEERISKTDRKNWGVAEIEFWRRGMEVLISQGYERDLLNLEESAKRRQEKIWNTDFPVPFEMALGFLKRIQPCLEKRLVPDHSDTLSVLINLGNLLTTKGHYEEAKVLYERVLKVREKTPEDNHLDTLMIVNNLACLLINIRDYKGAETLLRRVLEGYREALGLDNLNTLDSMNNMGALLVHMGDDAEAEKLYRSALAGYKKIRGLSHEDTLRTMNNLGSLLNNRGENKEAEVLLQMAFDGYKRYLGRDYPETFRCADNLGIVFSKNHNRSKAIKFIRGLFNESDAAKDELSYNLACYECLEGNIKAAKDLLEQHLKKYPSKIAQALADEDFRTIHDWLEDLKSCASASFH
jgi:tetratricopeptide (TPR) repeat protein